ncbi:TetR/AcrR family transcriptional regulator [Amaricoccus solimangrovi]|uniref:TetR/AcrR family transcriptional regulator n=1 Tax=Amaricoccus solimangrovi TaxID=2589815 RepID=A0A501WLG8_9RHOB|nr:TetR/AcrR family transcriptional regulator [Amaricoccus solimangrovi]TPE48984.1 TetR/AcrR family transcriptional regulator [Amaricoccus solimangrovi]
MNEKPARPYRQSKRARSQEETRLRIVEATMRLHEELGPRNTTISAIAERAGVQRLTVYRHFPDETAVFQACTAHWLSLNPPPDPADWAAIADPRARFRAAIAAFHGYFSRTRAMWTVSFRDVAEVPALHGPMAEVAAFLAGVAADLVAAFGAEAAPHVAPTIRHALAFPTWADLEAQGLTNAEKLDLVTGWLFGHEGWRAPGAA